MREALVAVPALLTILFSWGCQQKADPAGPTQTASAPQRAPIAAPSFSAPPIASAAPSSPPAKPPVTPDHSWEVTFGGKRKLGTRARGLFGLAFHPDGVRALSSSVDESILWDLRTGEALRRFEGHEFQNNHVAFSPGGDRVLAAGFPVRYWDLESGKDVFALPHGDAAEDPVPATSVAISRSGAFGAASIPGSVFVWDLKDGHLVRSASVVGQVLSLRFDPAEGRLGAVTDGSSCDIDVRGTAAPRCAAFPLAKMSRLTAAVTDGKVALTGGDTGEVFSVASAGGKLGRKTRPQTKRAVFTLALSESKRRLLVTGDATAALLGADRFERIAALGPFATPTSIGAISETGTLALVAEESGDVWLFKLPP